MEYDRSLYRVYERVMDDLNASPAISGRDLNRSDDLLPMFIPLSFLEFINRYLSARQFQYLSLPQYSRNRNDTETENQNSIELTNIQRNTNPLYSHLTRRMQIRMGEHRRAFIVHDNLEHGNVGNHIESPTQGSDESRASRENRHIQTDISITSSNSNSTSSYSSDSSSQSDSETILSDTSREEQRNERRIRRERRMRRRQARIDEPIGETLRRIRNSRRDRNNNRASDDPHGCTQKNLYWLMQFAMFFGMFHLLVLFVLHHTYVGAGVWKQGILQWGSKIHPENRPQTCLESALKTRPPTERSTYGESNNLAYTNLTKKEILERRPLLGLDEILQIKIIHGGICTGQCSRVHNIIPNHLEDNQSLETTKSKEYSNSVIDNILLNKENKGVALDPSTIEYYSTTEYWDTAHYRYASMEAIMFLEKTFELEHNLSIVNVTLTERCLSAGSDHKKATFLTRISEGLSQAYGEDTAIINQLMYGIRDLPPLLSDDEETGKDKTSNRKNPAKNKKFENANMYKNGNAIMYRNGYVQNIESEERWNWNRDILELADERTPIYWLLGKLGILFTCSLSFFLITSVTALIVRVLTGSGVVLMFPIFYVFRILGVQGIDYRILGLSYPWIGRPLDAMHRQNVNPVSHLIWAHMGKIMLYYVMYEACQATWSSVLYAKSIPAAMPVWIFGMAMFWEYFTMVFVRSALSVYFFPRIALFYYTCFHIYFYSVPYGYFDVALIPLFFLMLQAMLYTILALEMPAASRGVISMECPREVYSRLSWPEWTASLPVEWTLFLPLNSRYIPLHDRGNEEMRVLLDEHSSDTGSEGGVEEEISDDNGIDQEPIVEELDIQNVSSSHSDRPGLHARRTGNSERNDTDSSAYNMV